MYGIGTSCSAANAIAVSSARHGTPTSRRGRVASPESAQRDAQRPRLARALRRQQRRGRREPEHERHEARREALAADVVVENGVVVALACERDAVLGARQLLLEREHVLV